MRKAKRRSSLPDRSVHDFAERVLLGRLDTEGPGRPDPEVVRRFRRRFQQLTGPVMAKSLEDTLFYRFVELLALNEVGGDPGEYGLTAEHFHGLQAARARDWPNAMITTATHDTKRGEDARTRLLALSEIPGEWAQAWDLWGRVAEPHLTAVEGEPAPDANDQWMFLQAILGAWPLELLAENPDPKDVEAFRRRLGAYAEKAMREGKRRSSWVNVDEAYEGAVAKLFDALVAPGSEFLREFRPFAARLARVGMVTGLARSALKCTLPGLPDIYQGTEFWDFSFVDPDNRRPVDYAEREAALGQDTALEDLLAAWPDGRIKQRVLARLLADRAAHPGFYAEADYVPVAAEGEGATRVVAFLRQDATAGSEAGDLLVAVPRHVADNLADDLAGEDGRSVAGAFGGTVLPVPEGSVWRDLVTGDEVRAEGRHVSVDRLFARLPLAVLRRSAT